MAVEVGGKIGCRIKSVAMYARDDASIIVGGGGSFRREGTEIPSLVRRLIFFPLQVKRNFGEKSWKRERGRKEKERGWNIPLSWVSGSESCSN